MGLILSILNFVLMVYMFYSKNQMISIPLLFIGLTAFILDVFEMKKNNDYNSLQITKGVGFLIFEVFFFLDYFFHFVDFMDEF